MTFGPVDRKMQIDTSLRSFVSAVISGFEFTVIKLLYSHGDIVAFLDVAFLECVKLDNSIGRVLVI